MMKTLKKSRWSFKVYVNQKLTDFRIDVCQSETLMRKKIEGMVFFIANFQILTKDYKDKYIYYVYLYRLIVHHKISNVC